MQKIIIFSIISFFFIIKAENLDRIAIFPFKTKGIDKDSSTIFVELLRNEVNNSKQYEVMEYTDMKEILSDYRYKGDNLYYDDEYSFVIGKFLSAKKIVQGFLKKKRNTFSINIRFIDVKNEEIILDVTEHYKGTFEELLTNKIPKFAEMISWSTKYLNSVDNTKNNREHSLGKRDNKSKLRILFGLTSLVSVGGGVIVNYLAEEKIKEYLRIEKEYKRTDTIEQYTSSNKRYEDTYQAANQRIMLRNILYSLAGTGLTCFSITFFF